MSVIVKDLIKNYYQLDTNTRLDLDLAIHYLSRDDTLDDNERISIKLTMEGSSVVEIAKLIGVSSRHVNRILDVASDKISDRLGDEYKDDSIINRVEHKLGRPLTEAEIAYCWFMIRLYNAGIRKNITIFNFRIARNGKFVPRDEDKTERQMDL